MRNCLYCGHTIEDDALTTCPKCDAVDPAVQPAVTVASAEPDKTPSPVAPGSTIADAEVLGIEVANERAHCLAWTECCVEEATVIAGINSGAWPIDERDATESDADGTSLGGPGY